MKGIKELFAFRLTAMLAWDIYLITLYLSLMFCVLDASSILYLSLNEAK